MSSTHKKVVVRKVDRDAMNGYVSPAAFLVEGKLELLNTAGNVVGMELSDVKAVFFVREFGETSALNRKTFSARPRTEGIWVRLKFRDNDTLEGVMPADLSQNPPEGYFLIPPDLRSNTQRIFVPRLALESITVLSVIGAAKAKRRAAADAAQEPLLFQ